MSKFNPHPLYAALLGAFAAPSLIANTETAPNQAQQLSTIVVSAAGYEQKITDAPASISVITAEELQKKGVTSIADALTDVPGVDVRNGQGKTGGLNIQMRGLGQDYTLILIDGQRQNTSGTISPNGFGEFSSSFLPPLASIERIEVIKGPMSTLYGSDAMGGVINIITKKVGDSWSGNISVDRTVQENRNIGDSWKTSAAVNGPLIPDVLGLQLRGDFYQRANSDQAMPRPSIRWCSATAWPVSLPWEQIRLAWITSTRFCLIWRATAPAPGQPASRLSTPQKCAANSCCSRCWKSAPLPARPKSI